MGEEKQFGVTAKSKAESSDGFSSSGRIPSWSKSDFTSNGTLKRDYFKSHSYAPHTTLDSDGTLGSSGNESDSSEELHYGPGFVSRLKSRYMSVALRGSTGLYGKAGPGNRKRTNLRRTASLEDFLEQEKNGEQAEIKEIPPKTTTTTFAKNLKTTPAVAAAGPTSNRATAKPGSVETRASRSKDRSRQDSIKRCQSVEVLSIQRSDSSENRPPPLPPKTERPLETILNTTLANEVELVGEDNNVAEKKVVRFRKPVPEVSPASIASLRKPFHKRRSSGLLFGVEERELPAPDTVKETRKIFESNDKTSAGRAPITKSQSTSSLYQTTYSRSPSRERNDNFQTRLTRKKSDENLNRRTSAEPQRRVNYVNYINNKSSLYRHVQPKVNSKPSLPTKPTNIQFSSPRRDAATDTENSNNNNNAPALPAKKANLASTDDNNRNNQNKNLQNLPEDVGVKVISNDSLKNIRLSGATFSFSFQSDNASVRNQNAKTYLPNLIPPGPGSRQVGVIKPITRDPEPSSGPPRPAPKIEEPIVEKEVIILDKAERHLEMPFLRPISKAPEPKQVNPPPEMPARLPWKTFGGVIKQEEKSSGPLGTTSEPPAPVPAARGVRFSPASTNEGQILTAKPAIINTSDSSEDTEDSSFEPPKDQPREIIVEREVPPPRLFWQEQSTRIEEVIPPPKHFSPSSDDPSGPEFSTVLLKPVHKEKVIVEEKTVLPVLPALPPPRILHDKQIPVEEKVVASPPRSPQLSSNAKSEELKPRLRSKVDSTPNSMVFNFVNSDKTVSHIENDGLDMSKRRSKKAKDSGIVIIPGIGESTDDADDSELEEVDHNRPVSPCKITFLGANVIHGKSSIRSKPRTKKLNISFSETLPEVFEYPSYDNTPTSNGSNAATLKSTNNAVGSFGGLGSYTPSKIHGLDNTFQLGVTRTPARNNNNNQESSNDADETTNDVIVAPSESLWPAKDAVSWSGTTSAFSDMLF